MTYIAPTSEGIVNLNIQQVCKATILYLINLTWECTALIQEVQNEKIIIDVLLDAPGSSTPKKRKTCKKKKKTLSAEGKGIYPTVGGWGLMRRTLPKASQ